VSYRLHEHLLATLREALTNVGKHAQATRVNVDVTVTGEGCRLIVTDNGLGVHGSSPGGGGGLGLPNLQRRAEKLQGTMAVDDAPGGGTVLTWTVPIDP
jgi:signal transduction histidine kinase